MCEPVSMTATMAAIGSSLASATAATGSAIAATAGAIGSAAAATGSAIASGAAAVGSSIASGASALGGMVGIGGAGAGTAGTGLATGATLAEIPTAVSGLTALETAGAATFGSGLTSAGLPIFGGLSSGLASGVTATGLSAGQMATLALTAGSSLYEGYKGKQEADYQSAVASNNAKVARYNQAAVEEAGRAERQQIRLDAAQVEGMGTAQWGASGVQLGSGAPLSWAMDTAERAAYDIAVSQDNTNMQMWGYRAEEQDYRQQSKLYRRKGMMDFGTGILDAAGTTAMSFTDWPDYWGYGGSYSRRRR